MKPDDILAEWVRVYGELSPEQRERFLVKGGHVDRLVELPDDVVRDAIANRRRLGDIEAFAMGRRRQGQRRQGSGPAPVHDRHWSEYGRLTMRRPPRPEQAIDQGLCSACGLHLTPEGRCDCS